MLSLVTVAAVSGMTDPAEPPPPSWRSAVGIVVWLATVAVAAWAAIRLLGWERGPLVQMFAFTPYVAGAALVLLALALVVRRWRAAAVAALAVLALAGAVLPRALPTDPGPDHPDGRVLRVLTANLQLGEADPETLAGMVRDHRVDVLALQEFTAAAESALDQAGLADELPYRRTNPIDGSPGSAIYSRYRLDDSGVRRNIGGFTQAYATVDVPDGEPVLVESVHPCAPYSIRSLSCWWPDLAAQPAATPDGPIRILAGDFNATLDHVALRRLLDTGYRDAAAAVGAGLIPTWGPYDRRPLPPVTLDRILVDERVGVEDVTVLGLPGSDHRAVLAELRLPPGTQPPE